MCPALGRLPSRRQNHTRFETIFQPVVLDSEATASVRTSMGTEAGYSCFLGTGEDLGEEVRGRLSGQGFSTERREERRRMRSEFPRWGNKRADEPIPEPILDLAGQMKGFIERQTG